MILEGRAVGWKEEEGGSGFLGGAHCAPLPCSVTHILPCSRSESTHEREPGSGASTIQSRARLPKVQLQVIRPSSLIEMKLLLSLPMVSYHPPTIVQISGLFNCQASEDAITELSIQDEVVPPRALMQTIDHCAADRSNHQPAIKSAPVAESDHTVQHTVLSGNRLERIHIIGIQC